MRVLKFVLLTATYCLVCNLGTGTVGKPVTSDSESSALYYLLNYGYIQKSDNENTASLLSQDALTKALKEFQVKRMSIWEMQLNSKR